MDIASGKRYFCGLVIFGRGHWLENADLGRGDDRGTSTDDANATSTPPGRALVGEKARVRVWAFFRDRARTANVTAADAYHRPPRGRHPRNRVPSLVRGAKARDGRRTLSKESPTAPLQTHPPLHRYFNCRLFPCVFQKKKIPTFFSRYYYNIIV